MATKKKVAAKKGAGKKPVRKKAVRTDESFLENYRDIDIISLVPADWNYKEEDLATQRSLVENIRQNGQIENVIVRKVGPAQWEVINGNHRLKAFQTLEYETVLCYDMGEITLEHAKRIAIETNETRFESDRMKLAKTIAELSAKFGTKELSVTLPYSEQEIDNTRQILNFDWTDKSKRVRCPNCQKHFKAK